MFGRPVVTFPVTRQGLLGATLAHGSAAALTDTTMGATLGSACVGAIALMALPCSGERPSMALRLKRLAVGSEVVALLSLGAEHLFDIPTHAEVVAGTAPDFIGASIASVVETLGQTAVEVQAAELNETLILEAIRRGAFVDSTGVRKSG